MGIAEPWVRKVTAVEFRLRAKEPAATEVARKDQKLKLLNWLLVLRHCLSVFRYLWRLPVAAQQKKY